jgi:hypothetical protein
VLAVAAWLVLRRSDVRTEVAAGVTS